MTLHTFFRRPFGRLLAALTGAALLSGYAPAAFAQASKSTSIVRGVVLDPAGAPARDFRVVFRDVVSGTRYTSTATNAQGSYLVELPVGVSYKIDNVIAADGVTKLAVEDVAPITALATGTADLNVRFKNAQAPVVKPAGSALGGETVSKGPWYKQPGPIIGMVVGTVGITLIVVGRQSGSEASPF